MATRNGKSGRQRTAMQWVEDQHNDPQHRDAIAAIGTEIDLRQDLIALREQAGLTQVQLAQKLGVTQPVIARIEGHLTKDIKLSTLVKLAAALGSRVRITFEPSAVAVKPRKVAARRKAAAV